MPETPAPDYINYMDISEFRALGLVQEINRLILHPLGLALEVKRDETGEHLSGVWDFRNDPEGIVFEEGYAKPAAAASVADMIEARGPARIAELGYVVQPFPPEVKQLKVSVLEHTEFRIGPNGEIDEGEERPGVVVEGELLP